MYSYWLDEYATDDFHLIHTETCLRLPALELRDPIGLHATCQDALQMAHLYFEQVRGCPHCLAPCNEEPS